MRTSLTASLLLFSGLMYPAHTTLSALPVDLEGSGNDLDISGSGSGDWSEQGEIKTVQDNNKDVRTFAVKVGGGTENTSHGSSVQSFDSTYWPAKDSGSGLVVFANSRSLLEREEVFSAVIAGGVTGAALAAVLTGMLIYKWQKKDDGGYILGQQSASDGDYHIPNRTEVV